MIVDFDLSKARPIGLNGRIVYRCDEHPDLPERYVVLEDGKQRILTGEDQVSPYLRGETYSMFT